jgi:hypothetical protein
VEKGGTGSEVIYIIIGGANRQRDGEEGQEA